MELIRGLHNIRSRHKGCVLTIGNFDGVHLGHQALLHHLKEESLRQGRPAMVITFEPQPLEVFSPEDAPPRITRLRDKYKFIAQCGIDYLLCVKFNYNFAAMTAEEFIALLLVEKLEINRIIVGDDFRFGCWRAGNIDLLKLYGQQYRFGASSAESVITQQGIRISSTAIRIALQQGELDKAEMMLGRPYSISGRVIHGDAIGRTIGFPTANISLDNQQCPIHGVYAVDVLGYAKQCFYGVANVGMRPTVSGQRRLLEVHLLDFNQNLYTKHLNIVFRRKLRNEQKFDSLEELKKQIDNDVAHARHFLTECL